MKLYARSKGKEEVVMEGPLPRLRRRLIQLRKFAPRGKKRLITGSKIKIEFRIGE